MSFCRWFNSYRVLIFILFLWLNLSLVLTKVGKFYMVFLDERKGREAYSVSEDAFSTEEDALRTASKKTNLRSQLLSFCQVWRLESWIVERGHFSNFVACLKKVQEKKGLYLWYIVEMNGQGKLWWAEKQVFWWAQWCLCSVWTGKVFFPGL